MLPAISDNGLTKRRDLARCVSDMASLVPSRHLAAGRPEMARLFLLSSTTGGDVIPWLRRRQGRAQKNPLLADRSESARSSTFKPRACHLGDF